MKSLNDIKIENYLNIDFYLSKSCNKSCYYCTAWTLEMRNLIVDMTFLKNTLECMKNYKVRINLLGGEPGLIKNLREVVDEIQKYPNFQLCILSNSLIRKKYPWVLEDSSINYVEHLVLDFHDDRIEKLGNYDFFPENDNNNYNLIIMTPRYEIYKDNFDLSALDHKNTQFKEYNSRSPTYNVTSQEDEINRKLCSTFPSVPVIDFELQMIRHCSRKAINGSRTFDINQENVDKMMNFSLFEYESYCKTCTDVVNTKDVYHIINVLNYNSRLQ